MSISELFDATDSEAFRGDVARLLRQNAHHLRGMDAKRYIEKCRQLWRKTKTDKLYAVRHLAEGLISGSKNDDLRCVTVAIVEVETDISGTQWHPSRDYVARRKPLNANRRELIFVFPTGTLSPEPDKPVPSTQLVALFDVLGFEAKLREIGLEAMYRK